MRRYRVLARAPYGPQMLTAAAVFYPGQAALGIVLLLTLHRVTGSFATAGVAGAADTLGFSLSSILQGRLLDRRGARILLPFAAASACAITAIDVALLTGASAPVLIALAGLVGATVPSAGASLRSVWSSLLEDRDERATAFAYQSLAQDTGFVIGPATFGALATITSPAWALSACSAMLLAGAVTVATLPIPPCATRTQTAASSQRSLARTLGPLAATLATVGVTLGAIDVSIAAFATEHHRQQLAGVLLATFSAGSVAGGLAYGARTWKAGLPTRLLGGALALALLSLAPVAAPSIAVAALALPLAGAPLAATLTTAFLLASELAPTERRTEAYAILSLTLNSGAALGGALGGQLVAAAGARPGFLLAVASPLLGAAILANPTLRSAMTVPRKDRSTNT
jgi:MFS family permease